MTCHSCLAPIKRELYCKRCKNSLFQGHTIKELLFDKQDFYEKQTELSGLISISGVQDKISLVLDGATLIPTDRHGRYILKPVPQHQHLIHREDIVANEHLSMQISRQIFKLNTAFCAVIPFNDGELAYITKRFDYAKDNTKLSQEDFASVLLRTSQYHGKDYKYNASYEEIARSILNFVPTSMLSLIELFKRIVLNYLIGNGDAHLKNFSLMRPEGQNDYMLSPSYDLLYTKYHINETIGDMALELFSNNETRSYAALGYYSQEDFEAFANLFGIPKKIVKSFFSFLEKSEGSVHQLIEQSFLSEPAKHAYRDNYSNRLHHAVLYKIGGNYTYSSLYP